MREVRYYLFEYVQQQDMYRLRIWNSGGELKGYKLYDTKKKVKQLLKKYKDEYGLIMIELDKSKGGNMNDIEEAYEKLANENQKLKDEVFELNRRLKWIEDLSKGMLNFDLIKEVIKKNG